MLRNKSPLFFTFMTLLFTGACILNAPPPRNTRYIADISSMTKVDFYHDTWIYRNPKRQVTEYNHFIIVPVRVYENTAIKVKKGNRALFKDKAEALTSKLNAVIGSNYQLASHPGPNTLQMEMEVLDIKPIVTLMKDGNRVTVVGDDIKGSKLEINGYDSQTGELVYGLSTLYKGAEYLAYENPALYPNVEKGFEEWIAFFKNRFDEAMAKEGK